jgi:hypothetical protein
MEKSASHSLASEFTRMFEKDKITVNQFQIYRTMKNEERIGEMVELIDKSEILIISSPLYVDCAPYMTIKLMNLISDKIKEGKISKKKRMLMAISCAGFLEYYHNDVALRIYEQFAKKNGFTWAGGLPIGAAGTYVAYPLSKLLEMVETLPKDDWRIEYYGKPAIILDKVIQIAVENLTKGEVVPKKELERLHHVAMPLKAYAEGGNKNWIGWAEQLGTVDKLRDKPYEK